MTSLSLGYVRGPAADWFWFVLLPPLAVGLAIISETWLTFVALASINLWITVPHHFGTWCRTYGLREDWQRFRLRVILGPILIILAIVAGFMWAPLTVFIVTLLWDHQHSVMQQHGVARIYDFKAKSGGPNMGRLDLWLNITLYANMLLTVPLWVEIWVQQLYAWNLPIDAPLIRSIQWASYALTGAFAVFYVAQVGRSVAFGHKLNPMKYAFLLSSYALWYYAGWHTNSLLVYGIAHKLMHGLQYLVIVFWFLERKQADNGAKPWMLPKLNGLNFAMVGLAYSLILQLLIMRPLSEFGFGLVSPSVPSTLTQVSQSVSRPYEIYAATLVSSTAVIHYYFDSFIWKIRDARTQKGL
jgi:hypothetical protein